MLYYSRARAPSPCRVHCTWELWSGTSTVNAEWGWKMMLLSFSAFAERRQQWQWNYLNHESISSPHPSQCWRQPYHFALHGCALSAGISRSLSWHFPTTWCGIFHFLFANFLSILSSIGRFDELFNQLQRAWRISKLNWMLLKLERDATEENVKEKPIIVRKLKALFLCLSCTSVSHSPKQFSGRHFVGGSESLLTATSPFFSTNFLCENGNFHFAESQPTTHNVLPAICCKLEIKILHPMPPTNELLHVQKGLALVEPGGDGGKLKIVYEMEKFAHNFRFRLCVCCWLNFLSLLKMSFHIALIGGSNFGTS